MNCLLCGNEFLGAWTDFHGEMTCMTCGAPHQMKDYHGAPKDQKYPYLDLNKKFQQIFKEYWEKTKRRCRLGRWLGGLPPDVAKEQKDFKDWLANNHPEWLE